MSGKKGISRYGQEMKDRVVQAHSSGTSIRELSRQYGISRYAIQSWCGLRKEVELRHAAPLPK
jgi:transposase